MGFKYCTHLHEAKANVSISHSGQCLEVTSGPQSPGFTPRRVLLVQQIRSVGKKLFQLQKSLYAFLCISNVYDHLERCAKTIKVIS